MAKYLRRTLACGYRVRKTIAHLSEVISCGESHNPSEREMDIGLAIPRRSSEGCDVDCCSDVDKVAAVKDSRTTPLDGAVVGLPAV